jgi:2-(1,2-epoxy-1,2-dihydrophenyl)acetyl-CoA isomerase
MFIRTELEQSVATITLDRPEKLNAFTGTMREDLLAALRAADESDAVRAVVVTGAGRAFCAGGDVAFMHELQSRDDVTAFRRLLDAGRDVILQIVSMTKPVIASVNGMAAGAGANLALACDYRIASDAAKLSESFVRIALHPDWGGTWLLPRIVGRSRAFELLATGRAVGAEEGLAIGLFDRVVPAAELAPETAALAQSFAAAPPVAMRGLKKALAAAEVNDLRAQLELEAEHQTACFLSDEAKQRIAAFAKKE